MIKKYKHISFDLDGTLVHTLPEYRHRLMPKVVSELGGVIKNKESIDRFWFEAGRDKIIREEFKTEPVLFWPLFRKMDEAHGRALHTMAYDDVELSLKKIKESGKILSIISGIPYRLGELEIEKLNGAPYDFFLSILSSNHKEKPDPESFFFALKKLKVSPKDTLYIIGNSNEDALYAKNAGVDFVHIDRKEYNFTLSGHAIAAIDSLERLFD